MKNPILKFREKPIINKNILDLGQYSIKNGVHKQGLKNLTITTQLSTTLITKTREAVDMSETSFE